MKLIVLILFVLINSLNGCIHDGNNYRDGETWVEKDVFVMRCRMEDDGVSWMVEIAGCKTPSGTEIPLNSTVIDGNYEWKCIKNDNGQVMMQKVPHANAKCGTHQRGEQWREKSFLYICKPGGQQELLACLTENDERINVGESKEVNGYIVKCEKYRNGTVVMHGIYKGVGDGSNFQLQCIDSKGKKHATGTYWVDEKRFNKTCLPSGKIELVNCIARDGIQIPLNREKIIDDTKYTCEKTADGRIRFAAGPIDDST